MSPESVKTFVISTMERLQFRLTALIAAWQGSRYKQPITIAVGLLAIAGFLAVAGVMLLVIGSADLVNFAGLLLALYMPIPFIVYFGWTGVLLGTIAVWGCLLLRVILLMLLVYPPQLGLLNVAGVYMFYGWIVGLVWCLALLTIRSLLPRSDIAIESAWAEMTSLSDFAFAVLLIGILALNTPPKPEDQEDVAYKPLFQRDREACAQGFARGQNYIPSGRFNETFDCIPAAKAPPAP